MIDEQDLDELRSQLHDAREELQRAEARLAEYQEAIADATEILGHEGNGPEDLRDAVGAVQRLLDGHDLDLDYEGAAKRVRRLMWETRILRRVKAFLNGEIDMPGSAFVAEVTAEQRRSCDD